MTKPSCVASSFSNPVLSFKFCLSPSKNSLRDEFTIALFAYLRHEKEMKELWILRCPFCSEQLEPLILNTYSDSKDGQIYENIWWTCRGLRTKSCVFPLNMPTDIYWTRRTIEQSKHGHIPPPNLHLLPQKYYYLYPEIFSSSGIRNPSLFDPNNIAHCFDPGMNLKSFLRYNKDKIIEDYNSSKNRVQNDGDAGTSSQSRASRISNGRSKLLVKTSSPGKTPFMRSNSGRKPKKHGNLWSHPFDLNNSLNMIAESGSNLSTIPQTSKHSQETPLTSDTSSDDDESHKKPLDMELVEELLSVEKRVASLVRTRLGLSTKPKNSNKKYNNYDNRNNGIDLSHNINDGDFNAAQQQMIIQGTNINNINNDCSYFNVVAGGDGNASSLVDSVVVAGGGGGNTSSIVDSVVAGAETSALGQQQQDDNSWVNDLLADDYMF